MPKGDTENNMGLLDVLKEQLKQSSEVRFLHRLHCVLLVSRGHTGVEVASWFGDDPSSVARWVRYYREFGIPGLQDDQRSGRPAKLNIEQMRALERDLCQTPSAFAYDDPVWNGKLLAAHIQRRFDVELSVRQCQRLLRQLHPQDVVAPVATIGKQRS
jgi:transposase